MRIAAVYNRFIRGGGLENYLSDFLSQLVARGHQIEVITEQTDSSTHPTPPDIRIQKLPRRGLSAAARLRSFDQRAAQAVQDLAPDISIGFGRTTTHDLHRAGGGCHRIYSDLLPLGKRLGGKNRAELALEHDLYSSGKTQCFVCNSQMVADQITEVYRVESDRIFVIQTPVDHHHFHPRDPEDQTRNEICAELRTDPKTPVFLFVSLGHRRKGLDTILRAWPKIDHAHLWIIGSPLRSRHQAEIDKRKIGQRVFHLGRPQDTAPYYRAADFFLHPTRYDACANTALQSMASGLPGLISTHDGARELVHPGKTGFLLDDPQNADSLTATIEQALALDAKTKKAMSEAARRQVLHLTWEHHLGQWLRLIEQIQTHR